LASRSWRRLRSDSLLHPSAKTLPSLLLVEADLFISYLTGDNLEPHFRKVVDAGLEGRVELVSSSEVYDDVVSALRSDKIPLGTIQGFLQDMMTIPHRALAVTVEIAASAVDLYLRHGGRRKLHYFDSFHVATSEKERIPLLTSDGYILDHSKAMNISSIDPRSF
jgi:predicted nucleic acid-binding protein